MPNKRQDVIVHSGTWMGIGYIGVKHEDGSVSIHYEPIENKLVRDYVEKSGVYCLSQHTDNEQIDILAKEQLSESVGVHWSELEAEWEHTRHVQQQERDYKAWNHYLSIEKEERGEGYAE